MKKYFLVAINFFSIIGIVVFLYLLLTLEKEQTKQYEIKTNLSEVIDVDSLIQKSTLLNKSLFVKQSRKNGKKRNYLIYLMNSADCKLCIEEIKNLILFSSKIKTDKNIQQLVAIKSDNSRRSEWIGRGIGVNLPILCRIPMNFLNLLEKFGHDKSTKQLIMIKEDGKVVFRLKFSIGLKIDSSLENFFIETLK